MRMTHYNLPVLFPFPTEKRVAIPTKIPLRLSRNPDAASRPPSIYAPNLDISAHPLDLDRNGAAAGLKSLTSPRSQAAAVVEVIRSGSSAAMTNLHPRDPAARPPLVPLATLIGREINRSEKPSIRYGHSALAKRGEDLILTEPHRLRLPDDPSSSLSVFGIFDGHNGVSAAVFAKDHLLDHVMSAVPSGIGRDGWLRALPTALVAGFVKTDIDFQRKGEASGTTATLVVIDGLMVTVASVGDSRCILDSRDGVVTLLTVDHRLEENVEERERVTASGGEVGRINLYGGQQIGPLRCWPGGLCLSRSIGDMDVGEYIVPIPHVKQVKLSSAGGRLIIASDGIWDSLSSELAAQTCRGLPADLAAKLVVKEALRKSGLKDDTTCLVVDIIASDHPVLPPSPKKNQNKLRSLLFGKGCKPTNKPSSVGAVEEIFEEGSAVLDERLATSFLLKANISPSQCAICQVQKVPSEVLTSSAELYLSPSSKSLESPYLCADCRRKKDAMEGKRAGLPMASR